MNSIPSLRSMSDFDINPPVVENGTIFQDLSLSPSPSMLATELFFPANQITQTPRKKFNRQDAETQTCVENCVSVQKNPVSKPKRQISGKKMIKMNESPEKPKRKRVSRKKQIEERETLAFRGMEKFVCVYFCKECHENTTYDGRTLTIMLCDQCRQRVNEL